MLIPSPAFREFRELARKGSDQAVIDRGQSVLDALGSDAAQQVLIPAALVLIGSSLYAADRFADAAAYLERGLADLPHSAANREIGDGDPYTITYLELLLRLGRFRDAWSIAETASEPTQSLEVRLGATRAQVAVTSAFGDFDRSQQLLNTAAGIAKRLRNRQSAAIVDGDRAMVLARQGRIVEAVALADQVLVLLGRLGAGPVLAQSSTQAVAITTTLARIAQRTGDDMTAQRMLLLAAGPTEHTGRRFDRALFELAQATVWNQTGFTELAEGAADDARRTFLFLGCAPAAAETQQLRGEIAACRGLTLSARPLLQQARAEYGALGLNRHVSDIDALLRT